MDRSLIVARPHRRQAHSRGVGAIAVVLLCTLASPAAASAGSAPPAATPALGARFRSDVITVKFRDDLAIRAGGNGLTDNGSGALAGANAALARLAGGRWQRTHGHADAQLERLRAGASLRSNRPAPDLRAQFYFFLPPGRDAADVIAELGALDCVERAEGVPVPVAAPVASDFESQQVYLGAAPSGINASAVRDWPGGTGINCRVADLEYSWNLSHHDLPPVTRLGPAPIDPYSNTDHGTAVLGELVALQNGWGVTGGAFGSPAYVVATNTTVWDVGAAVITALTAMRPGDVIVIEQQMAGPHFTGAGQNGLVPVEWYKPWYDAIVTAVNNGVVVVEAAGNGGENLDDPAYSQGNGGHYPFTPGKDSGAIIVGAGGGPTLSFTDRRRLRFSNYGSTVDLQGQGENVCTTGYGDLYSADGNDNAFTAGFSGTSSATPMVAAACLLLQSIHQTVTGLPLSPAEVRTLLRSTGSPQPGAEFEGQIGPRPDVRAAVIASLGGGAGGACSADWNRDGGVTPSDVSAFVATWFTGLTAGIPAGDFDGDGTVAPSDVSKFIAAWFAALVGGCQG